MTTHLPCRKILGRLPPGSGDLVTSARADRLPALPVCDGPLDGRGSAAGERRLDREGSPSVRAAGRPLDRTTVNSWKDGEFVEAVHATGRRKLVLCALGTEVCMAFAALDAVREGYEVYPVVDAFG